MSNKGVVLFATLLCSGVSALFQDVGLVQNSRASFSYYPVVGLSNPLVDLSNSLVGLSKDLSNLTLASSGSDDTFGYGKPPDEFAQSYGYPAEVHTVTTDDGYILNLYRIPHGKGDADADANAGAKPAKPVALIVHGLAVNAGSWFGRDSDSLPFLLADEGFDVWLACPRGSIYSKKHVNLTADSEEFWNYSWHENGIYDVPSTVSYIVNATGQEKIQYVGHSMGTTMFMVWCSLLESCREHVQGAYLMAPVVYLAHVKGVSDPGGYVINSPLQILLNLFSKVLLHDEFQLSNPAVRALLVPLCSSELTFAVCMAVVQTVSGVEAFGEAGLKEIRDYFRSSPDSLSYKQLINFGQEIGKPYLFQRYDYGSVALNEEKYGCEEPPRYPLQNVTVPVSLYYGGRDFLGDGRDAYDAAQDLPNVKRLIGIDSYTHLDFLVGKSAHSRLYVPLVNNMKEDIISE